MPSKSLSSGDLVADRRAHYARLLSEAGDAAAAAELMEQALELVPGWAAGWSLLGDYRAEAGDRAGAIAATEQLARLDREGVFAPALKLAALGAAALPSGTETAYVAALFDDYAGRFESELLERLDYAAPGELAALVGRVLDSRGDEQVASALDLGCGTGLMGERLRRRVSFLEGIDLSAEMLARAGEKQVYDRLVQGELAAVLAGYAGSVALVAAADVLNYCGALPPVLAAVARVLAPGGLFAFSLERHDGPEPLVLRPSLRYAHSADGAFAACRAAGLEVIASETTVLRYDRGVPVEGLLIAAARPSPVSVPPPVPRHEEPGAPAPELH